MTRRKNFKNQERYKIDTDLKIAIVGCGFWAGYQVAAWYETGQITSFIFCDSDDSKASELAREYCHSSFVYSIEELAAIDNLKAVDIITPPETHMNMVMKSLPLKVPVICQKPMAENMADAEAMVSQCKLQNIPFFIHENFRWQKPIRRFKEILDSNVIGRQHRCRIYYNNSFPVFENQPNLMDLNRFIIADVGVHLFDVVRYLFGEVDSLYCQVQQLNSKIKGEDMATILLKMKSGMTCTLEVSYASIVEEDCFPQTLIQVEGTKGSIQLKPNYTLQIVNRDGMNKEKVTIPRYKWLDPEYEVVHSSMVDINKNFIDGIKDPECVETTGIDNLNTLRLVYKAYESAERNEVVVIK